MAYDPYGYPMYVDPYAYQDPWAGYEAEPEEETASQKLKKEQEMIEAIESNRLYLRKVKRLCVQEDFADLEKKQLFLFEVLIESLKVNTASDLGLVPETDDTAELTVGVTFLDSPQLEVREKGEKMEKSDSVVGETEYFETIGNAGLKDAIDTGSNHPSSHDDQSEPSYDTEWGNSSGKSCLFSKTALEMIQGLERSCVKLQVSRCVKTVQDKDKDEDENEDEDEDGDGGKEGSDICEPLGYANIHLPEHFSLSILQSCKSGVVLPVSCLHRDTCEVKNVFGVKKGELQVFVRLSCFGSVIITSFQSVGPDRQYVFKPSPHPDYEKRDEAEVQRDLVLKPIVAEEEAAIGITVIKEEDEPFQKPVLWKNGHQNCGCLEEVEPKQYKEESCLRHPRQSDVSLCRHTEASERPGKPFCEWHHLVKEEIKNSPGGNCGCIDDVKVIQGPGSSYRDSGDSSTKIPSRIEKLMMKTPEKEVELVKGLLLGPEPTDCQCDCAQIRNSLALHPLMKYNWQVK